MNKNTRTFSIVLSLFGIGLFGATWVTNSNTNLVASLQDAPILLEVPPLAQSQGTSCGEATIVMTYSYAHPQTPLREADVINYATEEGYFTPGKEPFTSPNNMVNITRHYTLRYSSGVVLNADQGLALLIRNLKTGNPVIIDVLTYLDDPQSDAHFVLVTGVSVDPNDPSMVIIHYNNPLTGVAESAPWGGDIGMWNAWKNNPDPGGSGWWLVMPVN